jgi:hypothetical protein
MRGGCHDFGLMPNWEKAMFINRCDPNVADNGFVAWGVGKLGRASDRSAAIAAGRLLLADAAG